VHEVQPHNVLLLGETRSGKTTFRKILKNVNYLPKLEVWRGTVVPLTRTSLFEIGGKHIMLNIIDTPGFGEAADGSFARTDDNLKALISDFVKRDITKLSLVLVTINSAGGIGQAQVEQMTNCLILLGREVAPRTCFLVTHFENRGEEDEENWIATFKKNKNMGFLLRACRGGFLFTGALTPAQFDEVSLRDAFIRQQRRRNMVLFQKIVEGEPVSLMSPQMADARSIFAVQESVTTSCVGLRTILPKVKEKWNKALDFRLKLSEALSEHRAKIERDPKLLADVQDAIRCLGVIGDADNDLQTMNLDDDAFELMRDYEVKGRLIREKYDRVQGYSNDYSALEQLGARVWNEVEWSI
jgi:GTP-binding protein EngB required for normal cell division